MQNLIKRETIEIVLVAVASIIALVLAIMFLPEQRSKVYDCRMSEISPDFPPEVREECRRIRATKI